MIIFHDKLLEVGGSEIVLKQLISNKKKVTIYTSCINDINFWRKYLNCENINQPILLKFIKKQKHFRILYPFIVFVCFLYPKINNKEFTIFYSSSAAKFFRVVKN